MLTKQLASLLKPTDAYCYLDSHSAKGFLWSMGASIHLHSPGPEDLTDFPVEKELGGLPHLFSPKWGNQLSSVLLVHGLGRVLAADEALGQLCPVVSITTTQMESFIHQTPVPIIFLETLAGGVTARIWESLSVIISLNILNDIFKRSLTDYSWYLPNIPELNHPSLLLVFIMTINILLKILKNLIILTCIF